MKERINQQAHFTKVRVKCTKCLEIKPLEEFPYGKAKHRAKKVNDFKTKCIKCHNEETKPIKPAKLPKSHPGKDILAPEKRLSKPRKRETLVRCVECRELVSLSAYFSGDTSVPCDECLMKGN